MKQYALLLYVPEYAHASTYRFQRLEGNPVVNLSLA